MNDLIERLESATEGDLKRFEDKYMPEPMSGCWLWIGTTVPTRGGRFRGNFSVGGRPILAHRAAYLMFRGRIPKGMMVCHRCDMPSCVNPDHLFLGTHADNMADMVNKGRSAPARYPELYRRLGKESGEKNTWARGARNPRAKLTAAEASAIRNDRRPTKKLAALYGIDRTTVQRIRRGDLWNAASLKAREME